MNPVGRLNATFAAGIANPGRVGFVSQSGALLTAVLDWAAHEDVGFSSIVSLGSMLDVGWGDVIDYLGDDPNTDSIVIYMETIGDARAFLSSAREVALTKPIIVIKPGRTAEAAKAAASHTGSLTGSDDVLDAAFRRAGVLRVDSISELFMVSEILAKQPRPGGRRLSIVTNAGGPGVIATDALIGGGGELTELTPETMDRAQRRPAGRLEPQQPDRHHRGRPARSVRQGARGGGGRPGLGRAARHPHAPGDDRPDRDGAGARAARTNRRQAGAGVVDGRPGRRGGRGDPPRGRHPHVRLPGHGLRPVQPPVAARRQPAIPVRDAAPARGPRARRVPRGGRHDHRRRRRRGTDAAHRIREQEGPRGVRHPDHRHGARADAGGGGRAPQARSATPSSRSS